MKFRWLTQQLIRTGIIGAVICFICLVIYIAISSYTESLTNSVAEVAGKASGTEAQFQQIQKQVGDARAALDFYNEFSGSESAEKENFRRDFARNLLVSIKDELNLMDIKFNMEAFKKLSGEYEKPHVAVYSSKVTVQFVAITDIDAYNLIARLGQAFPGYIKFESYKFLREKDISQEVLSQLGEGRIAQGLVSGEIVFNWQGVQDNPDYTGGAVLGQRGGATPPPNTPPNQGAPDGQPPGMQPPTAPGG